MSNGFKQGITNSMDCLHASEDTYEEVMNVINKDARVMAPRGAWSWMKVAAVALVAVLVIGTGAYAAATGVFENMFGKLGHTNVGRQEDGIFHIKGVQYFDVSEGEAAAIVGDKIQYVNQTIEHDGYVLTAHAYLVDENGCAIGWATLSNEDGLDGIYSSGDGHLIKGDLVGPDWDGPFQYVSMRASDVPNPTGLSGSTYNSGVIVNYDTATDTSIDLVFYYASAECEVPGGIEFRMGFSEETWGEVDTIVKTDSVKPAAVLEAVDCGPYSVSPISIKHVNGVESMTNLTVNYADGSNQVILNDQYYNVALDYANTKGEQLYMPTALLNPDELVSVYLQSYNADGTISDHVFTPAE